VKKWRRHLHNWDPEEPSQIELIFDPNVLASVFGETKDMAMILRQLQEQVSELKQTGKTIGNQLKLDAIFVDNSSDDVVCDADATDGDGNDIRETFEKPSTVRMLVF